MTDVPPILEVQTRRRFGAWVSIVFGLFMTVPLVMLLMTGRFSLILAMTGPGAVAIGVWVLRRYRAPVPRIFLEADGLRVVPDMWGAPVQQWRWDQLDTVTVRRSGKTERLQFEGAGREASVLTWHLEAATSEVMRRLALHAEANGHHLVAETGPVSGLRTGVHRVTQGLPYA